MLAVFLTVKTKVKSKNGRLKSTRTTDLAYGYGLAINFTVEPAFYKEREDLRSTADSVEVREIQAEGDMLGLIIVRFPNLVYATPKTVWHGEMARFIYNNL